MATIQQEFDPDEKYPVKNLTVRANGGTVTIETLVEGAWELTDTVSASGSIQVSQRLQKVRITPTGGAFYEYQ